MLDPNEILKLSEGSERVASELQEDIIKAICERIALRLGRGDDYILTPRDKWQLEVLKDAGFLIDDLAKIIAKKTGRTVKEMRKAFAAAGVSSTKFDDVTYLQAGIPVVPIQQSPAMIRLLERGMNKTFQEWKNYTGTTLQECADQFIRECDRAYTAVLSGSVGYGEAVRNALQNITETGGKVVYPSGHEDTLEVATYRAVRTGISQAASDITSVRAAENGITLFITSSHLGARPTHEPWQGKVFWIDWDKLSLALGIEYNNPSEASVAEKAKYDEFVKATDIGTVTGLCGANCRHSYGPYIEGISHNPYEQFDSEENRKRYEIEQKQRAWERKIRKQKRKVEGLKAGLDKEDPSRALETTEKLRKEEKKLAQMRKDYKAFSAEHELKEQPYRLEIPEHSYFVKGESFTAPDRDELYIGLIEDSKALQKDSEFDLTGLWNGYRNFIPSINNPLLKSALAKQFSKSAFLRTTLNTHYDYDYKTLFFNSGLSESIDARFLISHELFHGYDFEVLRSWQNSKAVELVDNYVKIGVNDETLNAFLEFSLQEKDPHSAIADIVDALSQGSFYDRGLMSGHGSAYYKKNPIRLYREIFANIAGLDAIDDSSLQFIRDYFPNLLEAYNLLWR